MPAPHRVPLELRLHASRTRPGWPLFVSRAISAYQGALAISQEESGGIIVTLPGLGYGDRMNDYIFLMHNDARENAEQNCDAAWEKYLAMLRASGQFSGGSSIGPGICITKSGLAKKITSHLSGYLRIQAESLEHAKELLQGNPVLESGGTVEIRELPRD